MASPNEDAHSPLESSFPVLVPYAKELFLSESEFTSYLTALPKKVGKVAEPEEKEPASEHQKSPVKPSPQNELVSGLMCSRERNVTEQSLAAENKTFTENADVAFISTQSPLVDLFYELTDTLSGDRLVQHVEKAWEQDPLATLKIIFNSRSIHVGKASRPAAYRAFGWMYENHPKTLLANLVWLTRPIIAKKMGAKDDDKAKTATSDSKPESSKADDDGDFVMIGDEAENEVHKYDVKSGTAHGYWKDLLNILALAINESFDDPAAVLNVDKPRKFTKKSRDWSAENAKKRKREHRHKQFELMTEKFAGDPHYRALHLTVARLFAAQLKLDSELLKAGKVRGLSLAGKWAPSAKELHDQHTFIVSSIAELLHGSDTSNASQSERQMSLKHAREAYRQKTTSPLRKSLAVVERDIAAGTFSNIKYERLPSLAMSSYQKLFLKKDGERFNQYVDKVAEGQAKISGAVLLPSFLVSKARAMNSRGNRLRTLTEAKVLDGQWKSLVQRIKDSGKIESSIAVCDVSGSMWSPRRKDGSCPMDSAIGLSLLLAEVCQPPFGGCFITFSADPAVQAVGGANDSRTFVEKVSYIENSPWGMNTDFVKVFEDLILKIAVDQKVPKDDMVKTVFVLSDMQFDSACNTRAGGGRWSTSYERIKASYSKAGYDMPNIVFWNLAGENKGTKPVEADEEGVGLVSGYSQGMMKMFLDNGSFVDEETIEEEEIAEEASDGGTITTVKVTKKVKVDPLAVVKKAISHPSYQMLKVVD